VIYRVSHDDCSESIFPNGLPFGAYQHALALACGLYLDDPTAWDDLSLIFNLSALGSGAGCRFFGASARHDAATA